MRRSALAVVLATSVVAVAGCGGESNALDPAGRGAHRVASLWWLLLPLAAVAVAVVVLLVLVAVLRRRDDVSPRWTRHAFVGIAGIAVPVVVLVMVFVVVLGTMRDLTADAAAPGGVVQVIGRQWFWEVRYPGTGAVEANEIHVPVGRRVRLEVTAPVDDVIHSLWVPRLDRKIDLIPGRTNVIDIQADEAGTYRGQCAEFCGIAHAYMAFVVVADEPHDFDAWLERHRKPAADVTGTAKSGQQIFLGSCTYCHTVRGTAASGHIGPDLTHLASRRTIGAGRLPNTKGNLAGWILDPQQLKPGNKMPPIDLTGPQLQQLLAYLETLK